MHKLIRYPTRKHLAHAPEKSIPSLALILALAACGGSGSSDAGAGNDNPPATVPLVTLANTIVAYPGEAAELTLYAGQSRQFTLGFKTSDGGTASDLALALPAGGLPAGWRIGGNRSGCALVDGADGCQLTLAYAPAAAEPSSVVSFPYSYRNNKGDARTGSIAVKYSALPVNAATATWSPGGPVRGTAGKTIGVVLGFGTNDGSPGTELHVDTSLSSLPAGWASAEAGLDCASFGGGVPCALPLTYTPATAAPASVLSIDYRYRDSGGKQQAATAIINYSAVVPNTVVASLNPAGVVRARAGTSQQVTLSFAPSDINPAGRLRLLTDIGKLPAAWAVRATTLPCATVDGSGGCTLTLVYAPGPDEPAGKLDLDYAYTDAMGRELTGTTAISYASHDYQAYVSDFGGVENGALTGGVRQCELDKDGKLAACTKAAGTWPLPFANNVAVYGSHAYIGAYTLAEKGFPARPVTVCKIGDDNGLVDCAGSGPDFDQLVSMKVSRLGAFVIATRASQPELSYCKLASDGGLDGQLCRTFPNSIFKGIPNAVPLAMTSTDTRFYVYALNSPKEQSLYSCALLADGIPSCNSHALDLSGQIVQRMSSGQAGGKRYLYLTTSSPSDPFKLPGTVVKCAIDDNDVATACEKGVAPPGISEADLIRLSDMHMVRNKAWLVTGDTDSSKKIFSCDIDQKTGDLAGCVDAGTVEGMLNFGIAVR